MVIDAASIGDDRCAVLVPAHNELSTINTVLDDIRLHFSGEIIVVDDGSTDGTSEVLKFRDDITVIGFSFNRGYGAALVHGFTYARKVGIDYLLTMDCDGQHDPAFIDAFFHRIAMGFDIVSGSRYLSGSRAVGVAPDARRGINKRITATINADTDWNLTDAFCGFKAYRVSMLSKMAFNSTDYAMPLELWAQAYHTGLRVCELPIDRIYLDENRSFGGNLDDPALRESHYQSVWRRAIADSPCENADSSLVTLQSLEEAI